MKHSIPNDVLDSIKDDPKFLERSITAIKTEISRIDKGDITGSFIELSGATLDYRSTISHMLSLLEEINPSDSFLKEKIETTPIEKRDSLLYKKFTDLLNGRIK